jgi:hypothetical protein
MVLLGATWFAILSRRLRTPKPQRGADYLRRPNTASQATPDRLAPFALTPLADEAEDWLRQP